jgi:hypothetical protein
MSTTIEVTTARVLAAHLLDGFERSLDVGDPDALAAATTLVAAWLDTSPERVDRALEFAAATGRLRLWILCVRHPRVRRDHAALAANRPGAEHQLGEALTHLRGSR